MRFTPAYVSMSQIKIFRSLWGVEEPFSQSLLVKLKDQGFSGVEASLGDLNLLSSNSSITAVNQSLSSTDMLLIVGVYSHWQDYEEGEWTNESVDVHVARICSQLTLAASLNPVHINCHSGQDSFSMEQSIEYFIRVLEFQSTLKFTGTIGHETHRSRILYSPWTTLPLVSKFPDLRLTLGILILLLICF
jgi:hypothetical protein